MVKTENLRRVNLSETHPVRADVTPNILHSVTAVIPSTMTVCCKLGGLGAL